MSGRRHKPPRLVKKETQKMLPLAKIYFSYGLLFFSDKDSEAIAELLFVRYLLSMDEKSPLKFDLAALLAFSTVAKERNMRKAAQVLNISQPPLSRKIRRLEENLGIILFKRHSEGVELTEDGKKVFSITHPLLEQASEISNELAKLAQYRRAL